MRMGVFVVRFVLNGLLILHLSVGLGCTGAICFVKGEGWEMADMSICVKAELGGYELPESCIGLGGKGPD